MSQYKITLIGLENYLNPEHSVFENMLLPDGIDKEILIGTIMLRCQEFELLYSDPYFMTDAVNVWSRKYYWTFEKWAKLLKMDYEPLYNKDYYEESNDSHDGDYKKNQTGSASGSSIDSTDITRTDNITHSADFTRTDNLASTNDTTITHSEKAYNSSGYVGTTQDVTDQNTSNTGTQRNAGSESNTGTVRNSGSIDSTYENINSNGEAGNDSYENKHTYHGFGNIGIMSSQQLWLQEADLAKWNMYEHIADLFATEFCIMVY